MKKFILILFVAIGCVDTPKEADEVVEEATSAEEAFIRLIYDKALTESSAYENLRYLCKEIHQRPGGSEGASLAVQWAKKRMEEMGFDKVSLQEVMVPHWVRGDIEYCAVEASGGIEEKELNICALGNSIATSIEGVSGDVIEVHSLEEVAAMNREDVDGKIGLYKRRTDPLLISTGKAYGGCANQRGDGAAEAAPKGA